MELKVTGCILHTGKRSKDGYGYVGRLFAHRVVWERFHNTVIPKGMVIRHTCDNPPCINPEHLLLGTKKQNSEDMVARGRVKVAFGEGHYLAQLTEKDIKYIREVYIPRHPEFGTRALGRKLGVRHTAVGMAIRRRNWKHVV